MSFPGDPVEVYRAIGVKQIINASGTTTMYGGSRLRPEAMEVMNKAASVLVNLDDLNRKAGKIIANMLKAEAAVVCGGSAGGLVLQAAACIAGKEPAKMARLPDTTGMKDEIIIQTAQRFGYDQMYRVAGARLVNVGDGRRCNTWQMEAGFTERTAAVAYLFSPFTSRRVLPLKTVCEIAHSHSVPVIVDAASMLPPRENLFKYIPEGADMVIYSGGKGIRGPQGTGILVGRADLIEAAYANAAPHAFLGRCMKVAKEEVMGLLTALEIFLKEDEEAETRHYNEMCTRIADAIGQMPGLKASVEFDRINYIIPTTLLKFTSAWKGPSPALIWERMAMGDPPIYLQVLGEVDELCVEPINVLDNEVDIIIRRLKEELLKSK